MSKASRKKKKVRRKPFLGRIPLPAKSGYAFRPKKGKGSYRRVKKDWRREDG